MAGFEESYRFAARLRDFPVEARPLIKATMNEAGEEGEAYSKMLAPVRTGNLRNLIEFRAATDNGWTFLMLAAARAEYSTFVEYGTSQMAPQPFFNPGVELAADHIEDRLGFIMEAL